MTRLAALALLCCSCGVEALDPAGVVYLDESLPDVAYNGAMRAVEAWNVSGLTELTVDYGAPGDVENFDGAFVMPVQGGPGWLGQTVRRVRSGPIVWLNVGLDREDWTKTAMHELGHALGLEHAESGIMRSGESAPPCVDRATLRLALETFQPAARPQVTCAP